VNGYDYIIVGAGTAGCVLAARLTEDPARRVLLLEAGGHGPADLISVPAAWPQLAGSAADWGSVTIPQAGAGARPYPRGRVLGGSGAINAMAHLRGHPGVYDAWAAAPGAAGWSSAGLLPYFKRAEQTVGRDPSVRGTTGPVRVAPAAEASRHPAAVALAEALCALGFPVAGDPSGTSPEGVGWPDLAIDGGRRVSPASAYLHPAMDRPNLTVAAGAQVRRLTVTGSRCTGAVYLLDGAVAEARAGEVIVCAGAVGSPQLLLLSGIGPAARLTELGISPVIDLPGVGENLQDHPVVTLTYTSARPLPASAYNHGETYAALRSPLAGDWPDLHLFPILLPGAPPGSQPPAEGFTLAAAVTAPGSRGSVRLASADPAGAPLIDPGFLRARRDADRLAAGLSVLRSAAASSAFSPLAVTETVPGAATASGRELKTYIRRTAGSYCHPAGTCRMGAGEQAVTDPADLPVRGISGLRVVDASVIPLIPNVPLHATVLAIAEKAADLITRR
jgi:choline dehydrogenase-like flavoprotein